MYSRYFSSLCAERRHVTRTTSDLARTLEGLSFVLDEELAGIYPGGERFKRVREARIARAFRSVSIACVRHQRWTDAWNLYCKTLRMNYRLKLAAVSGRLPVHARIWFRPLTAITKQYHDC